MESPQQLLPDTYRLLAACDLTLVDISKGSGVGVEWLRKFKAELIPNPGVKNVQALHDFLAAHQRSGNGNGSVSAGSQVHES